MRLKLKSITAEKFKEVTGHDPINDDLDRCNCPQAGDLGHEQCGWHEARNLPNFMVPYSEVAKK
jgi:hypothetical protein